MTDSKYSTHTHTHTEGEVPPGAPTDVRTGGTAAAPLSYGAYSEKSPVDRSLEPSVTFWSRGALLKASRGIAGVAVGGGKRGEIGGFTAASRLRLFRTLARVDRSAGLPCFITLTYHERWPEDPREWKHQLKDLFLKQLIYELELRGLWKLEPQKRLAPHDHLLAWGSDEATLQSIVPGLWNEIAGYGSRDHLRWHEGKLGNRQCVEAVKSWEFVTRYASKYFGKEVEWEHVGRFWGVFNRAAMPWAEEITVGVSYQKIMEFMRAMRHFAKVRGRDYKSLTIMCAADHWMVKLLGNR